MPGQMNKRLIKKEAGKLGAHTCEVHKGDALANATSPTGRTRRTLRVKLFKQN
jgi:hypothetical protein